MLFGEGHILNILRLTYRT